MVRRRQQSCGGEQTHRRDAVGVKIPVKNRERGARMITEHGWIEREAPEYSDEQSDTRQSQSRMRNATKKPAKRCAFQGPSDCDPLSIKLDWENQRNEEQRGAAEERHLCISSRVGERCAFEQHEQPDQRRHRKRSRHQTWNCAGISVANELIHEIKMKRSSQCGRCPRHSFRSKLTMENEGKHAEHRLT